MATLRIIDIDKEQQFAFEESVASYVCDNLSKGYLFYRDGVSQNTKATEEDLFDVNANIVACKVVGDVPSLEDVGLAVITGGLSVFYQAYQAYDRLMNRSFDPPKYSSQTSANNSLGARSNDVRLGKRIEDIWGTDYKVFPSLLGSYKRFDSNNEEVECSILCVGAGDYEMTNLKDGDYAISGISTTKLNSYSTGTVISGAPTSVLTAASCEFTPISVRQNTSISAFEMYTKTNEAVLFASIDTRPGTTVYVNQLGDAPYVTVVSKIYVGGTPPEWIYEVRIERNGTDWMTLNWQVGDEIIFKGLAYAVDGQEVFYNNCAHRKAIITALTSATLSASVYVTMEQLSSPTLIWEHAPLNTTFVPVYTRFALYEPDETEGYPFKPSLPKPPYVGNEGVSSYGETILMDGDYCGIFHPLSYQPTIVVEFDEGENTSSYLLNFVCEQGTAKGSNTVVIEITDQLGRVTTEPHVLPADTTTPTRRVGYSIEITLSKNLTDETYTPLNFSCYRQTSTTDKLVLREVYKYKSLVGFSDPRTTILRMERRFNSLYGASGDMKLSMTATRKIHPVVEQGNMWSLDTNNLIAENKFDVVLANLHLDQFNGRSSATSLDYPTLKAARENVDNKFGAGYSSVGLTFDESNQKYGEEINSILYGVCCDVFQVGSRVYTYFEQSDTISMVFTHRDILPDTLKLNRVFRRNDNYDGVRLTYKDSLTGDKTNIDYPEVTLSNPLQVELKSVHTKNQATKKLLREYNKLIYQKTGCSFTSNSLGRRAVPGMVVSVVNTTKEVKYDGEIISTSTSSSGNIIAETSQWIPNGITSVFITDEEGNVSSWHCSKDTEFSIRFTTTPTVDIYTGWMKNKTRYQVVAGTSFDKYIVSGVSVKDYDNVEITCINYDDRYYGDDV